MSAAYAATRDPTEVLGRRVVAYLIDAVLPLVLLVILAAALGKTYDKHGSFLDLTGTNVCPLIRDRTSATFCIESTRTAFTLTGARFALVVALPTLVSFLNLVALQGATGASVGKHATGLRVVDAHGTVAGVGRALVRWVFLAVDSFCAILGLVVTIATHPHRRVGDFVAGTYVVGTADVGAPIGETGFQPGEADPSAYDSYASAYAPPTAGTTPSASASPSTTATTTSPSAPVWDASRHAWISYDPASRAWLRYDDAAAEWRPL